MVSKFPACLPGLGFFLGVISLGILFPRSAFEVFKVGGIGLLFLSTDLSQEKGGVRADYPETGKETPQETLQLKIRDVAGDVCRRG